jgi:hypothetical protein
MKLDLNAYPKNAERLTAAFRQAGLNVTVHYDRREHPAGNLRCLVDAEAVVPEVQLYIGGGSRVVIEDLRDGFALARVFYRVEYGSRFGFRDHIKILLSAAPEGVLVRRVPWHTKSIEEALQFAQNYVFDSFWKAAGRENRVKNCYHPRTA